MKEVTSTAEVNPMAARPSFIPPCIWAGHWLTVPEFARLVGRSPWTVHWWLRKETLSAFGLSVYEIRTGKKHSARIFIRNPYF
jgi:hypothetical protein